MVAEAGFEGLNLPVRDPFLNGESENDVAEVENLLREHGLAVNTIGFGKHECTTPGREEAVQNWLQVVLAVAGKLDAPVISIWPNLPKGVSIEDARAALTRNLRAMLPMAEEAGRVIGLEFEKGCTLDNYREGIAYIQEVDPRIKLTVDTYHLNNDQADMYEAAVALEGMISDVHISGSHRGEPGSEGDTIDYAAFMRGLKAIGYTGDLVLQYKLDDVESMKRACEFTKGLREMMV